MHIMDGMQPSGVGADCHIIIRIGTGPPFLIIVQIDQVINCMGIGLYQPPGMQPSGVFIANIIIYFNNSP